MLRFFAPYSENGGHTPIFPSLLRNCRPYSDFSVLTPNLASMLRFSRPYSEIAGHAPIFRSLLRIWRPYSDFPLLSPKSLSCSEILLSNRPTSLASRRFFDHCSTDARPQFDIHEGIANPNPLEVDTHSSYVDTGTSEVNTLPPEVNSLPPQVDIHAGKANSPPKRSAPTSNPLPSIKNKSVWPLETALSLSAIDPLNASFRRHPGKSECDGTRPRSDDTRLSSDDTQPCSDHTHLTLLGPRPRLKTKNRPPGEPACRITGFL